MLPMKNVLGLLICAVAALLSSSASAQQYPARTVKIIVPFPAGGAVDVLARILGGHMQQTLKQPVITENRPGAGGNIATDAVAKSAADGYTMLLTTNGHAISPSLYKKLPYDPVGDFEPVSLAVFLPLALVSSPKLEAKSFQELVSLAKSKPGILNYGSTGVGLILHLTMELIKREAQLDIQMVPFTGDAPLNQALDQGVVELAVVPVSGAVPHVQAGALRALGVTSAKRSSVLPDVPTLAEQGLTNFDTTSWLGVFVPAKTPRPVVLQLQSALSAALKDSGVVARLSTFGMEPVASTPEALAETLKSDMRKYAEIVKSANIPQQ